MGQNDVPDRLEDYRVDKIGRRQHRGLLDHSSRQRRVLGFGLRTRCRLRRRDRAPGAGAGRDRSTESVLRVLRPTSQRDRKGARARAFQPHVVLPRRPGGARLDLDGNPSEILTKIFHVLSGDGDFAQVWQHPPGTTYRQALPQPPALPWSGCRNGSWKPTSGVLTQRFRRRDQLVPRRGHELDVPQVPPRQHHPNALLLPVQRVDVDLLNWHGDDPIDKLKEHHADVRAVRTVPGGGHLLAMENPTEVEQGAARFPRGLDRSPST